MVQEQATKLHKNRSISLPLLVSISFFLLFCLVNLLICWKPDIPGHLYCFDDPYIHLSIASNLVNNGSWSLADNIFNSASSSPIWTLLLAFIGLVTGHYLTIPLILNIIAAVLLLWFVDWVLRKENIKASFRTIILFFIIFLTPLPMLVFCGMEHILHALLCVIFLILLSIDISQGNNKPGKEHELVDNISTLFNSRLRLALIYIIALVLPVVRYENLTLLFTAVVLYILRKRLSSAAILFCVSMILPVIYGWISIDQGHFALPVSVLVKTSGDHLSSPATFFHFRIADSLKVSIHTFLAVAVLAGSYLRFKESKPGWDFRGVIGILYVITCLVHLVFSIYNWMYRHDAYLIVLGILALLLVFNRLNLQEFKNYRPNPKHIPQLIILFLMLYIISPALNDAKTRIKQNFLVPTAVGNIQQQQVQMGTFLGKYYPDEMIAINDIGAVSWMTDVSIFDCFGLDELEVAKSMISGTYSKQVMFELADESGATIALIHEEYFIECGGVPEEWIKLGEWEIKNAIYCAPVVSIFALNENEVSKLQSALNDYSDSLPEELVQRYFY